MPMTHISNAQSGWIFLTGAGLPVVDRPACPCPKRARFVAGIVAAGIYSGPAAPEKIAPRDP
jgi:hypothetical protein